MSLQFLQSLSKWAPERDKQRWALGAVIQTKGSVYRKAGALMLLSESGDQLGILSGGCLESDLMLQARKAIGLNKCLRVVYDAEDEDGLAWKLGIGCGGVAEIALLPCHKDNNYLGLVSIHEAISQGHSVAVNLDIENLQSSITATKRQFKPQAANFSNGCLSLSVNPPPHLAVLGGGIDMQSLCSLAITMGWRVSVIDHRPANARAEHFPDPIERLNSSPSELQQQTLASFDAAIVASHSLNTDAEALRCLTGNTQNLRYLGLLGPQKRRMEVLELAKLDEQSLARPIAGPMGLALGGDLPEDVALAVLAECHAVLYESTALPMSRAYL